MRVSFALNMLPHSFFDEMAMYLRRERKNRFHLDETLLARLPTLYESCN